MSASQLHFAARQNDILYGGASLTAKRGAWLRNTEDRLFGIAYRDDRDTDDGGLVSGQLRLHVGTRAVERRAQRRR